MIWSLNFSFLYNLPLTLLSFCLLWVCVCVLGVCILTHEKLIFFGIILGAAFYKESVFFLLLAFFWFGFLISFYDLGKSGYIGSAYSHIICGCCITQKLLLYNMAMDRTCKNIGYQSVIYCIMSEYLYTGYKKAFYRVSVVQQFMQ